MKERPGENTAGDNAANNVAAHQTSTALSASEPETRRRAVGRLAELPPGIAIDLLLRALGDDDWRVRREAVGTAPALAQHEGLAERLVDELRRGENVGLRNAVVETLGRLGFAAVAPLEAAISELDADGRKLAAEALGASTCVEAQRALDLLTEDDDLNVRVAALEALTRLGSLAPDPVQGRLRRALEDESVFLQLAALRGLVQLRATIPWKQVEPMLGDATLRATALSAVALADTPEAAVHALIRGASNATPGAFRQAVFALNQLAESPSGMASLAALRAEPQAVTRLLEAAQSAADVELRRSALSAAAFAGVPGVVPITVEALGDPLLAERAQQALEHLGPTAASEIVELLEQASGTAPRAMTSDVFATLVEVLGSLLVRSDAPPDARSAGRGVLRRAATDKQPRVATTALFALSKLGEPSDLALVAERSLAPVRAVAVAAERALATLARQHPQAARTLFHAARGEDPVSLPATVLAGVLVEMSDEHRLGDDDATKFLRRALVAEEPRIRAAAVDATGSLGGVAATELFGYALADEDPRVQAAAARACGRRADDNFAARLQLVEQTNDPELLAIMLRALAERVGSSPARTFDNVEDVEARLGPLLCHVAPSVAVAAVEVLAQLTAESHAGVTLAPALKHPDEMVVRAALLKLPPNEQSAIAVGGAFDHPADAVRMLAAEWLGAVASSSDSGITATAAARILSKQESREQGREVSQVIRDALASVRRQRGAD